MLNMKIGKGREGGGFQVETGAGVGEGQRQKLMVMGTLAELGKKNKICPQHPFHPTCGPA